MEFVGSSTHRKHKCKKHKKHKAKDDIISDLPESVINHILSFLPTKDVVRTSVLSKRWIEKWTLITKVELDDSVFYSSKKKSERKTLQQCFINFVNRVLLLTGSHSVESFSLAIANNYDPSVLNTLITFILKKRVKKLSISSRDKLTFSALTIYYLYNHATCLEELVIMNTGYSAIKIPLYKISGVLLFTSLKLLKLRGVEFTIDKSQQIIFSVLKKFESENCLWLSAGVADVTLELKAPLLESVLIVQNHVPLTSELPCKIKISDSRLKEFSYEGDGMTKDIVLSDHPPSACNVTFTNNFSSVQETESRVSPLLKQFSQVKRIKLQFYTEPNVAILPKFAMLSYLELGFVDIKFLLGLFQNSPALNTLVFKGLLESDNELLNSAAVPDCLISSLQVVKFGDVHGDEYELLLAKYLMENGTVLERMCFSVSYVCLGKPKVIEEFKEKLYSFKKGISFAILEFSYDYC